MLDRQGEVKMAKQVKKTEQKKVPAKAVPDKAPVAKAKVIGDSKVISVIVKENPKRGASRERFAFYKDGMSVEQYIARSVKAGNPAKLARADVAWDLQRQFISVQ
jgi:hypothetical protein